MSRCVVVVFSQGGCPACEEYVPRLQRIAGGFARIPTYVIDVSEHEDMADRFEIEATPTTMVLRKPIGAVKAEGALPDGEIQQLYSLAVAG